MRGIRRGLVRHHRRSLLPERHPAHLGSKLANVDFDCGREMPATGTGGLIAIDRDAFDLVEAWIADGAVAD